MLGDPVKVLGNVELSLSNVLIPECTDGQTFDALYCDASLSEEDLPMFLSLLKPNGRMVVIIDEVRSMFLCQQTPAALKMLVKLILIFFLHAHCPVLSPHRRQCW